MILLEACEACRLRAILTKPIVMLRNWEPVSHDHMAVSFSSWLFHSRYTKKFLEKSRIFSASYEVPSLWNDCLGGDDRAPVRPGLFSHNVGHLYTYNQGYFPTFTMKEWHLELPNIITTGWKNLEHFWNHLGCPALLKSFSYNTYWKCNRLSPSPLLILYFKQMISPAPGGAMQWIECKLWLTCLSRPLKLKSSSLHFHTPSWKSGKSGAQHATTSWFWASTKPRPNFLGLMDSCCLQPP